MTSYSYWEDQMRSWNYPHFPALKSDQILRIPYRENGKWHHDHANLFSAIATCIVQDGTHPISMQRLREVLSSFASRDNVEPSLTLVRRLDHDYLFTVTCAGNQDCQAGEYVVPTRSLLSEIYHGGYQVEVPPSLQDTEPLPIRPRSSRPRWLSIPQLIHRQG